MAYQSVKVQISNTTRLSEPNPACQCLETLVKIDFKLLVTNRPLLAHRDRVSPACCSAVGVAAHFVSLYDLSLPAE